MKEVLGNTRRGRDPVLGVTKSEDKDIKAALFQFISETEVKL